MVLDDKFSAFFLDTGIANEKEWGIDMLNENVNESGTNEDGSTWYRKSGENIGENGYRCRWTKMGGKSHDGASEWKEMVHMLLRLYCYGCQKIVFKKHSQAAFYV